MNGECYAQGSQFGIKENEVHTAVLNLDKISTYRSETNQPNFTGESHSFHKVRVDFDACQSNLLELTSP